MGELLEKSLPEDMERQIADIASEEPTVSAIHHLRTRRIGSHIAIDMHVRTLRQKLGAAGEAIRTVRKVGYKLSTEGSDD